MQMRSPTAIHVSSAERRDLFAGLDGAADFEPIQRFATQMAVEREELDRIIGLVAENDHGTVVLGRVVVGERVNDARQRGVDWSASLGKKVEPDVNRSML